MSVKKYVWLGPSGSSREVTHEGVHYPAVTLTTGEAFEGSSVAPHVLEEWVKTGAAKAVSDKKGKED